MENQNMESQTMAQEGQQEGTKANQQPYQQSEKLFTQDEVNRIIGERLARAKSTPGADYTEREQALNARELRLDAREKLADAGISKELLPLVNCSSKEEMENSIKLISAHLKERPATEGTYRVSTGGASTGSGNGHGNAGDAEIRAAMGLKG